MYAAYQSDLHADRRRVSEICRGYESVLPELLPAADVLHVLPVLKIMIVKKKHLTPALFLCMIIIVGDKHGKNSGTDIAV